MNPSAELRAGFEMPSGIYLRSNAVGCLPRSARSTTARFLDHWAEGGADSWGLWLDSVEGFRRALGRVLGAKAEELSVQVNLSAALTKLIGALPPRNGRRRIVYSELDFPSLGFVCQQSARLGYEPCAIPAQGGTLPLSVWDQYLTPDVQLAHVTHVLSNSGYQVDVPGVLRLCRERGIFAVVDVAQSAGVVPIELSSWDATCVIGCSVKWLCGGPGASFLWIRSDLLPELRPIDVGWFSHARPFELDIRHFEYAADANRFWGGTPSVLPYAVATCGLEAIHAIGLAPIRAHNLALTRALQDAARAADLQVNTPTDEALRGGSVAIGFPDNETAVRRLNEHGIRVDQRPPFGVRFSPHVYNTMQEIERVAELFSALR